MSQIIDTRVTPNLKVEPIGSHPVIQQIKATAEAAALGMKPLYQNSVITVPISDAVYRAMDAWNYTLPTTAGTQTITVTAAEVDPAGIYDRVELRYNAASDTWSKILVEKQKGIAGELAKIAQVGVVYSWLLDEGKSVTGIMLEGSGNITVNGKEIFLDSTSYNNVYTLANVGGVYILLTSDANYTVNPGNYNPFTVAMNAGVVVFDAKYSVADTNILNYTPEVGAKATMLYGEAQVKSNRFSGLTITNTAYGDTAAWAAKIASNLPSVFDFYFDIATVMSENLNQVTTIYIQYVDENNWLRLDILTSDANGVDRSVTLVKNKAGVLSNIAGALYAGSAAASWSVKVNSAGISIYKTGMLIRSYTWAECDNIKGSNMAFGSKNLSNLIEYDNLKIISA